MERRVFFTTRPRLASYLISQDHEGRKVTNPYEPERPAWEFLETKRLAYDVKRYCEANDMGLPPQLERYFRSCRNY